MPYTQEERKILDEVKTALARRLEVTPRPWSQEKYLEILKSNVETVPINAALMASRGQYGAARAMLQFAHNTVVEIQGLEEGWLEYRPGDGVFKVETGEKFWLTSNATLLPVYADNNRRPHDGNQDPADNG